MVIAEFSVEVQYNLYRMYMCCLFLCVCVCAHDPDEGGDGGDRGGGAGAAGSERPPSEVKGGLPRQVFGAGPAQEGGSSTERTGES